MERIGSPIPGILHGLDFFQDHFARVRYNAVNPASDAQDQFGRFQVVADPHLFFVASRSGVLEALMAFCSSQSAAWSGKNGITSEVAATQNKLDQFPHLNRINRL